MGASNYRGLKSELQQEGESVGQEMPWRHGAATFAAFLAAGSVPLLAYVATPWPMLRLPSALVAAAALFFVTGAARARFLPARTGRLGLEMLLIGLAAAAAFGVGVAADRLI